MFNSNEIENICRLLASQSSDSVLLGLEFVFQHPEVFPEVVVPAKLFMSFGYIGNSSDDWKIKQHLSKIWHETMSEAQKQQIETEMQILMTASRHAYSGREKFYEHLGAFEAVMDKYEPYILVNIHYLNIYKNLFWALSQHYQDIDGAYAYGMKVIEALPDDLNFKLRFSDFLLNICFCNGKYLNELARMEGIIREAIRAYPANEHYYQHVLGILYETYCADRQSAKMAYRRALELKPDLPFAMNNLANILFKIDGNAEEAKQLSSAAAELEPESIDVLDTLAWIEFKGFGNLDLAEQLFLKIRELDKKEKHHQSLTALGEILVQKGKLEEGKKYYLKGLRIKPESLYKLQKLVEYYQLLQDRKNTVRILEKMLKIAPENEFAKETLLKINIEH